LEGEGRGVFLLIWDGELKAAFCHRRLREKPPWGGVSVYCESVPLDQNLLEKSFALLKALDWQGVAMVEFKVDRSDGQAKLMEVNGRFWGSLQLAIDAGINFPLLLYRLATGENIPGQFEYRVGLKSRWLLGDLDHLLIRLRRASFPDGSRFSLAARLRAGLSFMKFWDSNTRFDVFRWDDRAPGWFETKSYLRAIFRRSKARREEACAH
jgi:predicted ATP-grasp superfamily ATP-dependent carboligase